MSKRFTLVALTLAFSLGGCVSIPPEAPELSTQLGQRIGAIETSHITLLNRFFDQKRAQVDQFIQNEWLPEFANQFFANPAIASAWNTIVSENDSQQRLMFLMKTGPKLQEAIDQKRQELIKPLDDLESSIEQKIRADYDQALALNNSITSYLTSAAQVAENRNRYLQALGVNDSQVAQLIDQTDTAVSKLVSQSTSLQDKVTRAQDFLAKVETIKKSLNNTETNHAN